MKKTESIEEAQDWLSRSKAGDHRAQEGYKSFWWKFCLLLLQTTRTHEEGLSEVQEDAKKRGGSGSNGASTSGKQTNQAGVTDEAVEKPCNVLSVIPGRGKRRFSYAWLLDSGHTICAQERNGSAHMSLLKEAQSWWVMILHAKQLEKAVSADDAWQTGANTQERKTHSRLKEKSSLVESLESSGIQIFDADGVLKVTKGSMTILKGERMTNLYEVIRNIVISDASMATKEDTSKLWLMRLRHMSERGLQALHSKEALPGTKYCKLILYKFCVMGK